VGKTLVSVAIPSVAERAALCAETVAQWHALGYAPHVALTPARTPRSPHAQGLTARRALALALAAAPDVPVVYCEDDVYLSSRLRDRLPDLALRGEAVALYLPGRSFYPAAIRAILDGGQTPPPCSAPIAGLARWFGAQAVLLPPDVARGLVAQAPHADPLRAGVDIALRDWLIAHRRPLLAAIPNLVQHRAPRSVTSPRYQAHRSSSYV